MSQEPRILVVDGYNQAGREDLEAGGATTAGNLYERLIKRCVPDAVVDQVFPADANSVLPKGASISQYDGIAWTGSSLTIYDDTREVTRQIDFAREAFIAGVPGFGSCWAAQIAVVAAGGLCAANPRGREMGIARKIRLTSEGRGHPLYTGKKSVFDAFISHDDEITHLPPGATLLAENDFTWVQAVSVTYRGGEFWGLQYHPEYDLHELARLCFCRKQKLTEKGFFQSVGKAQEFVDQLEALYANPERKDIAWLLAVDDDVISADIRIVEARNWMSQLVLARMKP